MYSIMLRHCTRVLNDVFVVLVYRSNVLLIVIP